MVVLEKAVALIRKRSPCAVQLENRSRAADYRLPMRAYLLHQPLAKAQHLLSRTQTRVQVHARQEPRWPLRLLERRSRLYLHSPARPCKSPQRVENHSSEKVLSWLTRAHSLKNNHLQPVLKKSFRTKNQKVSLCHLSVKSSTLTYFFSSRFIYSDQTF